MRPDVPIAIALSTYPHGTMTPMLELADDPEMAQRAESAREFFTAIGLEEGLRPVLVSDEAALYDIQPEDDDLVIRRVAEHYGATITVPDDFRRPFWQLLDDRQRRRT
jgi:hypothetical protein